MRILSLVLPVGFLIGAATSSFAQAVNTPSAPLHVTQTIVATPQPFASARRSAEERQQREDELQRWIAAFTEWKAWWAQWANRPEPGWFTSSRPRQQKPSPPVWLADECANLLTDEGTLAHACALLTEWRQDDLAARSSVMRDAAARGKEADTKTIWWEHIHIDVLWPATQLRTNVFGVIGMHTATTIRGRFEIFLAPGVMLLNLPTVDGTRVWKIAANYGIGYRLFDFAFPGNRKASLHVNVAKSWLVSDARDLIVRSNLDFAGFSITFNRR
jgi:hypothetical protein